MLAEDIRHPEKQPIVFERREEKIEKIKRETKEVGTGLCPERGVLKRGKFPSTRRHSHCQVCGKPWKHRARHSREGK